MTTTANGVVVEKPWYLSKKVWLCLVALGLAVLQSATGRWTDLTPEQLVARIAETATWLLPLIGTIQAIAHVDGKTRAAALIADALKAASHL
jgi:DMSO reductase anchor subunit